MGRKKKKITNRHVNSDSRQLMYASCLFHAKTTSMIITCVRAISIHRNYIQKKQKQKNTHKKKNPVFISMFRCCFSSFVVPTVHRLFVYQKMSAMLCNRLKYSKHTKFNCHYEFEHVNFLIVTSHLLVDCIRIS